VHESGHEQGAQQERVENDGGSLAGSDGLVAVAGCGPFLADAGDQEYHVVHGQSEEDGEHEDGQERFHGAGLAEVEQVQSPAELEHGDQDAEGRGGEQVDDGGDRGYQQAAEGEQEQREPRMRMTPMKISSPAAGQNP
jgi:hypothetical protein